jgi:hypothetical protein
VLEFEQQAPEDHGDMWFTAIILERTPTRNAEAFVSAA